MSGIPVFDPFTRLFLDELNTIPTAINALSTRTTGAENRVNAIADGTPQPVPPPGGAGGVIRRTFLRQSQTQFTTTSATYVELPGLVITITPPNTAARYLINADVMINTRRRDPINWNSSAAVGLTINGEQFPALAPVPAFQSTNENVVTESKFGLVLSGAGDPPFQTGVGQRTATGTDRQWRHRLHFLFYPASILPQTFRVVGRRPPTDAGSVGDGLDLNFFNDANLVNTPPDEPRTSSSASSLIIMQIGG